MSNPLAQIKCKEVKQDPSWLLFKAEIRYLNATGWVLYCGVMDCWAEKSNLAQRYTHEDALKIQKERDK